MKAFVLMCFPLVLDTLSLLMPPSILTLLTVHLYLYFKTILYFCILLFTFIAVSVCNCMFLCVGKHLTLPPGDKNNSIVWARLAHVHPNLPLR